MRNQKFLTAVVSQTKQKVSMSNILLYLLTTNTNRLQYKANSIIVISMQIK